MTSSHLPQWRRFEGYLFNDTIDFYILWDPTYNSGAGMYIMDDNSNAMSLGTVHCYHQKTNLSQMYSQLGTDFQDTITIVIRHNPRLYTYTEGDGSAENTVYATYHGRRYKVVSISPDDTHYGSYDYVLMKYEQGVKSIG